MVRLKPKETEKFIELYKLYGALWNVSHSEYNIKIVRDAAKQSIADSMGMSLADVAKKIKNIRLQISEIKKSIRDGHATGNLYRCPIF